jgi:hypothetical protein
VVGRIDRGVGERSWRRRATGSALSDKCSGALAPVLNGVAYLAGAFTATTGALDGHFKHGI